MWGRGQGKEKEFHFGCIECGVPGEHSREHVGLELKSKAGNIELRISASRW